MWRAEIARTRSETLARVINSGEGAVRKLYSCGRIRKKDVYGESVRVEVSLLLRKWSIYTLIGEERSTPLTRKPRSKNEVSILLLRRSIYTLIGGRACHPLNARTLLRASEAC